MGARHILACVATLGAAHSPLPAIAAKAPQVLDPSTPWNLDYADDSCALRREFGPADKRVVLELRQFAPDDSFEATLASKAFTTRDSTMKVQFVPQDAPRTIGRPLILTYPGGISALRWNDSLFQNDKSEDVGENATVQSQRPRGNAAYKAREASIRALEISGALTMPIVLQIGEMHQAMAGMRTCIDELMTHWGIDAVAQKTLTRRARPVGQVQWAKLIQANYPRTLLEAGKSGRVGVRMIVGADGKPISCHIQSVVQDVIFGQTACSGMMKAARFEPALDAAGKPIASYFLTRVIYKIN